MIHWHDGKKIADDAEGSYCSGYSAKICPMGPNRRAQERERAAARAAADAKRAEAERNAPPMRQSRPNSEFFAPSGSGARSN